MIFSKKLFQETFEEVFPVYICFDFVAEHFVAFLKRFVEYLKVIPESKRSY